VDEEIRTIDADLHSDNRRTGSSAVPQRTLGARHLVPHTHLRRMVRGVGSRGTRTASSAAMMG
jgi:hypothetical protein